MTNHEFGLGDKPKNFYEENVGEYVTVMTPGNYFEGQLQATAKQDYITLNPHARPTWEDGNNTWGLVDLPQEISIRSIEAKSLTTEKYVLGRIKYLNNQNKSPDQKS